MDKIIEYLLSKRKVEIAATTIFLVFTPMYVIEFLYYQKWFENTEIIKLTVLNAGILAVSYSVQVFLYMITNMFFTKKGRTIEDILVTPLVFLGIVVHLVVFARFFSDDLAQVVFVVTIISFIIELIFAIIYEKALD